MKGLHPLPSVLSSDPEDPVADDTVSTARRGGGLYFVASLVSQAFALLRYVVLARLLGPEQLGIAATLVVTGSFFDLISDTGGDRFLVQDRHGDAAPVQNLVQLVYLARGGVTALSLVVFAVPLAYFYHTPRLAGALATLALSPLLLGFSHLDPTRTQRNNDFRAAAICKIAGETVGVVGTVIAAWMTRDFTAVLYGMIARAVVMVMVSHVLAKRPYRLAWNRDHAPRLARFSAPLMLNGLIIFMVFQGDRVLVANQLGARALGYYSAIILLIVYPSNLLLNYIHAIYIPMIAAQRDSAADRDRLSDTLGGQTLLFAVAMCVGFAIVVPFLVPILYGARFTQTPLLVGLIGILQIMRFVQVWPTTVALAMGRTVTVLISNCAHGIAFAGAFAGLKIQGGLEGVVVGFIIGEVCANAVALARLNRDMGRALLLGFDRLAFLALAAGAIVGWNLVIGGGYWLGGVAMAAVTVALSAWCVRRESVVIRQTVSWARHLAVSRFPRLKG